MSAIQQIYCTHCTHGSSALERREGELAHRTLGYSVRAGSAEAGDLRHYYRQVERYLYYYLPRDTPSEEKLRLTAATAPWRLIYLPASGDLQLVGQVCYRQTDSEGRPGSYFAHVLFRRRDQRQADWSPLDCLKLWGAAGWVREDSPQIPFRLRPLDGLEEMLCGAVPAIDDQVFLSFLTAPAAGRFHDPCGVIPDRWRRQDAASRRRAFAEAFAALLEVGTQRPGSLLLVIEPSLSALFFYGMLRLLPGGGIRAALSFSTFEPNADRLCTTLAATWCHDPQQADLRPDALPMRGTVLSTIESHRPGGRHAQGVYAPCMLDKLLAEGWGAVDGALENLQAAAAQSFEDLEELAVADRLLGAMLAERKPLPQQWRGSPMTTAYLRRALAQRLAGRDDPQALLRPLLGLPAHLCAVELLALEADTPAAREAAEYLLLHLPDRQIADLLKSPTAAPDDKLFALARYVSAHGDLPPGCDSLWDEPAEGSAAQAPAGRPLLPLLLARLEPAALEKFFRSAAERHGETFLASLVEARRTAGADRNALTRIVRALDPAAVLPLHRRYGGEFFRHYPPDEPALAEKLHDLLRTLPDQPEQFSERLDVLLAAAPLLPAGGDHRAVAAWARCRRAMLDVGSLQNKKKAIGLGRFGLLENAARQMAEAVAQALPRDRFPDDPEGTNKQQCLRRLGAKLLQGAPLLPEEVWQHRALWRKIDWYFHDGKWPPEPLGRMRHRMRALRPQAAQPRSRSLLWALLGGALAVSVLLICIGAWAVWAGRARPPAARPRPRTPAENLSAAKAPLPKEREKTAAAPAAAEKEKAAARQAAGHDEAVEEPPPRQAEPQPENKSAQPAAREEEKTAPQTAPVPAASMAPAETEVQPRTEAEARRPAGHEASGQEDVRPPAAAGNQPTGVAPPAPPGPAQPPPANDSPAAAVPAIRGEFKVQRGALPVRLERPYVAELKLVVPTPSLPRRFGEEHFANCVVRQQTADGGQQITSIAEVFKQKTHRILDSTVRLELRFEFYRKATIPGAVPVKVAETPWYPIEPVESGNEYKIQFYPLKEELKKF